MNNRRSIILLVIIALSILMLSALTWVNYNYSKGNPGGSDFVFGWVAARSFLKEGLNPYSEEVSMGIREMLSSQPSFNEGDGIFVYPFYAMSVFFPFSFFGEYNLARALWMTALEISIVFIAILSIKLINRRFSTVVLVALLLFSIFWYHGMRAIINGNIVVIASLFIVISLGFIKSEHDFAAGLLIALATIKPNMAILFVVFVSIWGLFHRRWRLILGIFVGMMALIFGSMLFVPDWIFQNIIQIKAFSNFWSIGSPGEYISYILPGLGNQLRWGMTIVLGIFLLIEWRASLGKDFRWFLWTVCITLVISQLIGIQTDPGNYILLLLPLILVIAAMDHRWKKFGTLGVLVSLIFLFLGLWILFLTTIEYGTQPIQHPILFFPLPIILLVGLYLVRRYSTSPIITNLKNSERLD